jgi:uncharacterized RDD family membrane protein YckC
MTAVPAVGPGGVPAEPVSDQPVSDQPVGYAGLATRVVSFVIDAALITLVDIILGVGAALILSLLHLPHDVRVVLVALGGAAAILGSIAYFVIFWSTTGQTPGARVMQIQVLTDHGGRVKPGWAVVRCIGVVLAALPLFAGFIPVLYDSRRRGFQDQLARTVVIDAPGPSIADVSRAKRRAIREASRVPPPELPR